VFSVDGKPSTASGNGAGSGSGSQRVKATITPRAKVNEPTSPPAGMQLKPSQRIGADKP
jgi:hypothetical protein